MNKTALGTIVGAALLGLSKKLGSKSEAVSILSYHDVSLESYSPVTLWGVEENDENFQIALRTLNSIIDNNQQYILEDIPFANWVRFTGEQMDSEDGTDIVLELGISGEFTGRGQANNEIREELELKWDDTDAIDEAIWSKVHELVFPELQKVFGDHIRLTLNLYDADGGLVHVHNRMKFLDSEGNEVILPPENPMKLRDR
jgi:hypothetical protein